MLDDRTLAMIAGNLAGLHLDPILHLKIACAIVAPLLNGSGPIASAVPQGAGAQGAKWQAPARASRQSAAGKSTRGPGGKFMRATAPPVERAAPAPAGTAEDAIEKAQAYLREGLAGGPQPVSDVENRARRRGVTFSALDSAKTALGVIASRIDSDTRST